MLKADEANRRYFREGYRSGIHGWPVEEPSTYALGFLRRVCRSLRDGKLLDVGCGEGRHSIAAAKMGFRAVGVDYETLALERARRFARESAVQGVSFRRASVLELPFARASFDAVLDYGCLHHQRKEDWHAYKANLLRVLKPYGFYILSTFSPHFFMFRGSKRPWHIALGAYRRCFTAQEITALFEREFQILALKEERDANRGFWHALMRRHAE